MSEILHIFLLKIGISMVLPQNLVSLFLMFRRDRRRMENPTHFNWFDLDKIRHEIFPEFSRPQRSFLWKSQIRFDIYRWGGGFTIYCVCSLTVSNLGTDLDLHYYPILNTESSQVPGVCTTSTCTVVT